MVHRRKVITWAAGAVRVWPFGSQDGPTPPKGWQWVAVRVPAEPYVFLVCTETAERMISETDWREAVTLATATEREGRKTCGMNMKQLIHLCNTMETGL